MKIGTTNKINELAPTFTENFTKLTVHESICHNYNAKIEGLKDELRKASKYFFYNSHDSGILFVEKTRKKDLILQLNDISTFEFACALIDKRNLTIDKKSLLFPVELRSEGTTHLSLNMVDVCGEIYPCRFRKLDEYLYEEIITWENGRIEIAFDFWKNKLEPSSRYLMLLSCSQLIFIEHQKTYWKRYFGDEFDSYYNYFDNERNNGRYLSDYTLCKKLIDEYDLLNT